MNKVVTLLVIVMLVALVGCGAKSQTTKRVSGVPVAPVQTAPATTAQAVEQVDADMLEVGSLEQDMDFSVIDALEQDLA